MLRDTINGVSSMCSKLKWRRLGNFPAAGLATIQAQEWRFMGKPGYEALMRQWVNYFGSDATKSQSSTVGYSMPYQ